MPANHAAVVVAAAAVALVRNSAHRNSSSRPLRKTTSAAAISADPAAAEMMTFRSEKQRSFAKASKPSLAKAPARDREHLPCARRCSSD